MNATGASGSKVLVDTNRDGNFSGETWAGEGAQISLTLPTGWDTVNNIYVKDLPVNGEAVSYAHFVGWDGTVGSDDRDLINSLPLDGIERPNILMAAPYGMGAANYSAVITFLAHAPD